MNLWLQFGFKKYMFYKIIKFSVRQWPFAGHLEHGVLANRDAAAASSMFSGPPGRSRKVVLDT